MVKTERVTTPELNTGDVILSHGCKILLTSERHDIPPRWEGERASWFRGVIIDDNNGDNVITRAFGYATGHDWTVQGNQHAHWLRVTQEG